MREIKFRAWDKNLKEIIPVYNINFQKKMINTDGVWRMFGEIELMQYTGLKDKNGKEIYEGDVLQTTQYPCSPVDDYVLVVEYDIDRFWGVRTMKANATVRGISNGIADGLYEFVDEELEVIGNIYENPELINK